MAGAVSNATGNVYYSKVSSTTNLFFADPASVGAPTYTAAANVTATAFTAPSSEKGPAKGSIVDKLTIAAGFTTGNICYKNISSLNISAKEAITFYIKPSIAVAASVLSFVIDDTNACASVIETLPIPALAAGEWHRVLLRLNNPESDTAVLSVGLQAESDPGTVVIDIYQPRYMDEFEGRKSFSVTQNVDSIDASDYQTSNSKEFVAGPSSWTVTFEGHKEGAPPLDKNQEYVFALAEATTMGQAFVGNGFFTSFTPSGNVFDLMQYAYSVQGTRYLHQPVA